MIGSSSHIYKRKIVSAFIIDENIIQIGNTNCWMICIKLIRKYAWNSYFKGKKHVCYRKFLDLLLKLWKTCCLY